jgi:hypothetical protein
MPFDYADEPDDEVRCVTRRIVEWLRNLSDKPRFNVPYPLYRQTILFESG